ASKAVMPDDARADSSRGSIGGSAVVSVRSSWRARRSDSRSARARDMMFSPYLRLRAKYTAAPSAAQAGRGLIRPGGLHVRYAACLRTAKTLAYPRFDLLLGQPPPRGSHNDHRRRRRITDIVGGRAGPA